MSNILKSVTGDKVLSLTEMHGNGLRLRVMRILIQFKQLGSCFIKDLYDHELLKEYNKGAIVPLKFSFHQDKAENDALNSKCILCRKN